ncbi:MAG: hypothetical protein ACOH2E_05750 [Candidatus Paracaedibacter sp.]
MGLKEPLLSYDEKLQGIFFKELDSFKPAESLLSCELKETLFARLSLFNFFDGFGLFVPFNFFDGFGLSISFNVSSAPPQVK